VLATDSSRQGYPGRGLHGAVVESLGRRIVSGALSPGEALPAEPLLAREFDVSRTVVRETLRVLAAKGLVEARPMRGTRVRPRQAWRLLDPDLLRWSLSDGPKAALLRDLLDIRLMVEPAAARLAAERATPGDLAAVEQAWQRLRGSLDEPDAFIDADLALHAAVLAATRNQLLGELVAAVGTGLRLGRAVQVRVAGERRPLPADPLPAHGEVVDAILAGDGPRAERAMRAVVVSAARDAEAVIGPAATVDASAGGRGVAGTQRRPG
jgi:GntR family transcriptional regulator, galactonate operon transcriptional repressor